MSYNDITGKAIKTGIQNKAYNEGWERIFGKKKSLYSLFLDDIRFPKDAFLQKELSYLTEYSKIPENEWVIVRNYDDFVKTVEERGIPSAVSFDCDLASEHFKHYIKDSLITGIYEWENFKTKCGIHCAKYLKHMLNPDSDIKVYVHSANEEGRRIILDIMKDFLA